MSSKSELKIVTVHLPESYVEGLDALVSLRRYPNRSEAIRVAVRDLLKAELWEGGASKRTLRMYG
ncbi:MAG: ribbon-helix-helix domain-containing protein [Candidatus Nezhaarchaeales archaeon]